MTGADWVALVVTAALTVYLFVALVRPDTTR
ncbi:K(+)-transporting ATPase subunit F [Cellulomonas chengniuliangii]|uniref:K(+)-transporting ATPase subunit F n=1 Tax=Cellulomonas chengniuliangii TaxID=2968084 RepID=A0ABY5KZE2_9CELL|nr:K(+)-transporting ATPase subunit F [Cellulomonas chengniuliangii]MCC2309966.1 K(+)-transporting ATPase subunit F [Cellulomonas chengniuliangii]MCC2317052.1 K(+)-transporting ATPase subunit F [Cellulomonas chengniuliangii]UUI74632.1 K(+)-transporting ATPase subunit F [Cellulomonas chengniuliangii]